MNIAGLLYMRQAGFFKLFKKNKIGGKKHGNSYRTCDSSSDCGIDRQKHDQG